MIQVGTQLQVSDNSGAKIVECVKVLNKTRGNYGRIGDVLVVTVKEIVKKQKSKVKKGHMYKALVLETAAPQKRQDGSFYRSQRNATALLTAQGTPLGTRIQGISFYELRQKNYAKILSLSVTNI
jgi:large subunit ribosomal protein L14